MRIEETKKITSLEHGEFEMKCIGRFFILAFVLFAGPVSAQEICASTPDSLAAAKRAIAEITALARPAAPTIPVQGLWPLDEKLRELQQTFPPGSLVTPWGAPASPYMYKQFEQRAEQPEEKRFSWYGYRHKELHAKVIPELLQRTVGKNCCNGVFAGECRVSRYVTDGVGKRRVLIDDLECDITDDTRIVQLDTFEEQDTIVVCAHKTADPVRGYPRYCPRTYCIGGGRQGI